MTEKQDVASQRPVGIMKSIAALRNMKFALSELRLYAAVFLAALRKLLKTKKKLEVNRLSQLQELAIPLCLLDVVRQHPAFLS